MLRGSIVALITPMLPSGAVNWVSLTHLIEYHIEQGTDAIVAVGTTGESATLTEAEQIEVVTRCVKIAAGRIPIIAGCGSNSTAHAVELTKKMAKTGAVAGLSVTPYYNKPTQEGLFQHYKAIAEASDLPIILYNVPGRTGCDLLPETVGRLAGVKGIIGIKEATGDLTRVPKLRELCGQSFALYSGDDASARQFILDGGQGVISVTANVAAKEMSQMVYAALSGNREQAELLDKPLALLHRDLFIEANPIPVKWAVSRLGLIANDHMRLPLTPLSKEGVKAVAEALRSAGLIQ